MKKALSILVRDLLLYAILISSTQTIYSQNPGGVTGSVAWYKANDGVITTAGLVSTWSDRSASANDATQATAGSRPGLATNSINFNPAVTFLTTSTAQFLNAGGTNLPTGNGARTIFFVASFNNTATTNAWLYGYGGAAGASCRKYSVGKILGNNQLLISANSCPIDPANSFWALPDTPKLGTIALTATVGSFYDAGLPIGTDANPTLNTQATSSVIGASQESTAEYWRGTIGEIIIYPSAVTGTNATKVESYLALKYGIHKSGSYISSGGLSMWDASINASFHNDVFGIIVDNGSGLTQLQSNSVNTGSGDGTGKTGQGNIVLSAAALNNNEYVIIGHNTGNLVFDNNNLPASLAGYTRMSRVWLINRSSTIASATITGQFNYSGLGIVDPSVAGAFKLLVDTDGDNDFSNATAIDPASVNTTTSVVTFDVPITTALNAAQVSFAASAVALPVKLKSFGYNTRDCNATLKWTSVNEDKLKGYQIEENIDGSGWIKIKEVAATANNMSIEKNYSADVALHSGKNNLYRLKMIDINGSFTYSAILRIRCEGGRPEIILMPNPASTRITIGGIEPGDVIRIYSIKGAFIKGVTTAGNVEELNISSLPSGNYSAEVIRNNRRVFSKVFIKN